MDTPALLRKFCQADLELRQAKSRAKELRDPLILKRSYSYAVLLKVMNDENMDVVQLSSGKFLHRTMLRTQCSLKRELVLEACTAATDAFNSRDTAGAGDDPASVLEELTRTAVRSARTTQTAVVKIKERAPRVARDVAVPVASEYVESTVSTWVGSMGRLAEMRGEGSAEEKLLEEKREAALNMPGVSNFIRAQCGSGKNVDLDGSKYVLRHKTSMQRRPIREAHVAGAITKAVATVLEEDMERTAMAERLCDLVIQMAQDAAGVDECEVFSFNARAGRKRAADGIEK